MVEEKNVKKEEFLIDVSENSFQIIMDIYQVALMQIYQELTCFKEQNSDIIYNITKRIKTPESIIKKMKKKHYEENYTNLIENIEDIAGIRIVCPVKEDIKAVVKHIRQMNSINVLKEKDYISKPKKSGYSAYHLIVETPINFENKQLIVKVEIQIRTMAMDFWATIEHDIRYKTKEKISAIDSKRLSLYAKIINQLDDGIMKIRRRQKLRTMISS